MMDNEMKHIQFLGVASAAIGIIKEIAQDNERVLSREEIFAITDSHKMMFTYTGELYNELQVLKAKTSRFRYNFNKLSLQLMEDMKDLEE
mgnify:CR=1 FL=1|tara:strand:+ start:2880 stop:3149 length:270 start_codon:yes stop_codon:yes gene_type:complete